MDINQYWVYIIRCENHTYYTGYTTDLVRRYHEHVAGTGKCKYTRSFKPLNVAQCWCVYEKSLAMRMEKFIKKMSRKNKDNLVSNPHLLLHHFAEVIT
jgi:putative endonuclease